MDEGIAIILASVMAIVGIFFTSSLQRSLLRKQHTYDVLDKMNAWDELEAAIKALSEMVQNRRIPSIVITVDEKACDHVDFVLNHYEFICASIVSGDLDEYLVKRIERSRICRSYLKFIDYVEENRHARDTLKMWENVEFICFRWMIDQPDKYDVFLDRVFNKIHMASFQNGRADVSSRLKTLSASIS